MDLGRWLRSLGLQQYEAVFRENAIDETVLPDLTDQDLEKLGVLLGHRRKLLRAIAIKRGPRSPRFGSATRHPDLPRCRRAPSGDGDVFRLGWLNGTLGAHGP
jgi:hypothetical protein